MLFVTKLPTSLYKHNEISYFIFNNSFTFFLNKTKKGVGNKILNHYKKIGHSHLDNLDPSFDRIRGLLFWGAHD